MYREHAPVIAAGMREDPEIFKRGLVFVILSIRQRIDLMPGQMDEVEERRAEAPCLFGWKRRAYRHIELHGREMHETLNALWSADVLPAWAERQAIRALMQVPGLGIVKAAFAAQLFGFDVACIDSRNAEREGRKRDAFKYDKGRSTDARLEKLLTLYLSVTHGRAEEYWDAWCDYVAADYGLTGEQVSAIHLRILPDDYIPF